MSDQQPAGLEPGADPGTAPVAGAGTDPVQQPSFGGWMGSMWVYTILRFGLFLALWGIAYLAGVHSLLGPLIALVLSVPLSLVLLAKPRRRFSEQVALRMDARAAQRQRLDRELQSGDESL